MRLDSFAAATGSMKSISRKKFSAEPFDYEFTLIPMGEKGVPVVTKLSDDEHYLAVNRISNAEMNYVNDDSIDYHVMTLFSSYANKIGDGEVILITNKTVDKKSSQNPYMQDYARFFVQFLIGS